MNQEKRIKFLEATISRILWSGYHVWGEKMPLEFDAKIAKQYKLPRQYRKITPPTKGG